MKKHSLLEVNGDDKSYWKSVHDSVYNAITFLVIPSLLLQGFQFSIQFDIYFFSVCLAIQSLFMIYHYRNKDYKFAAHFMACFLISIYVINFTLKNGFYDTSLAWMIGILVFLAILFRRFKIILPYYAITCILVILGQYLVDQKLIGYNYATSSKANFFRVNAVAIVSSFFLYALYITREREKAYVEKLRANFEFNQVLLGVLYHDLSNHLTSILMNTSRLPDELKMIETNTKKIRDIVHNVREFEKIRYSRNKIKMKDLNVYECFELIYENFKKTLEKKNIKMNYTNIDNDITIKGNKDAFITSICGNIISNCITHSPEDSKIDVELEVEDDFVKISIKDQAGGIPQELLGNLFNYRLNKTTSQKGSGFGLPIAKGFIDLFGGKIEVDTCEKGSVFNIYLRRGDE